MLNTKDPCLEVRSTCPHSVGHEFRIRIILPGKHDNVVGQAFKDELFDPFAFALTVRDQIDKGCDDELETFIALRLSTTLVGARNFLAFARNALKLPRCKGCWGAPIGFISTCPICGQKGLDLL